MKRLFKTNINALEKVRRKLKMSQTMTHRQIILGATNSRHLREAEELIQKAIIKLTSIE